MLLTDSLGLPGQVHERVLLLDAVAMTITPFATPGGYPGSNQLLAGTWSEALDAALVLDTGNDVLRAYQQDETGAGTIVPTSTALDAPTSFGFATLFEVPTSGCPGAQVPFGLGLAGAGGAMPGLSGAGCPMPANPTTLRRDGALGGTHGALFAGLAPVALPFKGGTLLATPTWTVPLQLGDAPGQAGAGALDLPVTWPNDPGLSGVTVVLQAAFADGAAPAGVSLTQGLRVELG